MDRDLTILEHLAEFRRRIVIIFVSLLVTTSLSFPFAGEMLRLLKLPAAGVLDRLAVFTPQGAFLIYMRLSLLAGFIIALPLVLYQVWAFVSPAIEERFKRYAAHFVISGSIAFAAGCAFCYFLLLPRALAFLLGFGADEIVTIVSADSYISFVTGLVLCCGAIFQMPILSFILTKVRVINAGFLRRKSGIALVAIFIVSAVITPTTDIFNMLALAIPMLCLYEVSIWVSGLTAALSRKK